MQKSIEPKGGNWELSLGVYPGILLGIRTYVEEDSTLYVLYLPFIDLALEIFKN
jgi:hypothetical protein